MSRPFDRECKLPARGKIDESAGEFWVENPFDMPREGKNLSAYENNRLFLNLDGTSFVDASYGSTADLDSDSRSVVSADFNHDGLPDLLVGSVGGGPLRLFLNNFGSERAGQSVRVHLRGVVSNRQAIGSRIEATVGERKVVRDLFFQNGCLGQGPAECQIGLGDAKQIDKLRIRWPSGEWAEYPAVPAGASVTIQEGQAEFTIHDQDSAALTPAF